MSIRGPPVGAVRGHESRTAVHLTHRSAPFAADDRSHRLSAISVGAVRGRESLAAVHLTHRSAPFAADDRTYECEDQSSSSSSAVARIFSRVKPNSSNKAGAGADSPKLVMPITRPSRPTYLYQ
jgi:hypothetical protein